MNSQNLVRRSTLRY